MSGETLFVFGLGYSARAIVARMRANLDAVWGTTRDPDKIAEIAALGVTPILFDGSRAPASIPALRDAKLILASIAPDDAGDPVLRHFRDELAKAKPKAIVYLSTVGVYGDHGGEWVDEASECRPVSRRSRQRVGAEEEWRKFSADTGVPVAIIRLAGIYGPGRGPFEKIRKGTARRIIKRGQVFNRIHVEDIASIVEAAFARRANGVFNGVDDAPAPPEDVIAYAANLLGADPPPAIPFEEAELSPMAQSFYEESKRVRNESIKRELGVRLLYPSYREGLRAVLDAEGISPNASAISS